MTVQELQQFESEIAALFEAGKIRAPIHLSGGNESQLIEIFKDIPPDAWVCSNHRSHYHALLKGIPPEWLKQEIIEGRSITLCNREHRFITSAIVGGILPIAVGLAMAGEGVCCFIGDMAAETGIFHECVKYSEGHNLPITFIVEDNGVGVDTPTVQIWGRWSPLLTKSVLTYQYEREYPHQGTNKGWVTF